MRVFKIFLIVVAALFLFGDLLFWLMAHGSGHNIPVKTDLLFVVTGLGLLLLILILASKRYK
ncbi:MAG: hypothetical protein SFU21_02270 [Flavihumibacter sp.]|nr:hypothetical protein [Flavihumibacter sp.]